MLLQRGHGLGQVSDLTQKPENDENGQNQTQATRRSITPTAAMIPSRQRAKYKQDEQDDNDGGDHNGIP